jgi:hypothetical protein
MENGFQIYGYFYERKPRQFDEQPIDVSRLFTNEYVAQSYLAVVLKTPSDARARKYKVWGELHPTVFSGDAVEPYIVSAILAARVAGWLRSSAHMKSSDEIERLVAKRGSFHIARVAAFLWRNSDEWRMERAILKKQLGELEASPQVAEGQFVAAFKLLVETIKSSSEHSADVDRALKSSALDRDISKRLHKP